MNEKGFTLVELIATIALLAIIAIISFVSINAILNDSKSKNCESLISNITSAAKEYVSDNRYEFDNYEGFVVGDGISVTAQNLITGGYLSSQMFDPFSSEPLDSSLVKISIDLNKDYSARNIFVKVNGVEINCENKATFEYAIDLGSGTTGDTGGSTGGTPVGGVGGTSGSTGIQIIDKSGGSCPQGIEYFYAEGQYRYYFTCQKSENMYVSVNGVEYKLVYALQNKIVTIAQIESSTGYKFLKQKLNVQTS